MNKTAERISERPSRTENMLSRISENLEKNVTGLQFLSGVMAENPDRMYMDHREEYLIVRGTLASYKIPMNEMIDSFANPFHNGSGFPRVELHPLHKWLRRYPPKACIQPSDSHYEIPGTDSLGILALSLLNDTNLFMDSSQDSFRKECIKLYGFAQSPISELLNQYIANLGGELDSERGVISVNGTDGFRWIIGGLNDPSIRSLNLSSYVRDGPPRLHTADTFHSLSQCRDLEYLIEILSRSPKVFITGDDYDLAHSSEIIKSVAEVHAPLRRGIDDGTAFSADWVD